MSKVKGVIAAGHEATANAGREILEAGGNAVDAAIASAFAGCVAEPLLTGLGAGGYMMVHDAKSGQNELFDFAVVVPGKNLSKSRKANLEMTPIGVDFGGTIQVFHGGYASVGVPGFVAGLCAAHKKYGSIPLAELVRPAQKLAKQGVKITEKQNYLIEILFGIISITPAAKKLFTKNGERLKEGDIFSNPDLADSLEEIARTYGESVYKGRLADAIVNEMKKGGGLITADDLADYETAVRSPVKVDYRGYQIYTNPPPSSGGSLIAHSLKLLSEFNLKNMEWHSPQHIAHLLEVMLATNDIRKSYFDKSLHDEDVLEKLLASEVIANTKSTVSSRLGNTTHLSVIDSKGNAVSMTSTNGTSSGVVVPGTGIFLNNILGEEDLNPAGFHKHPAGHRMTSMMAPTIVTKNGEAVLSVGSAGSNRIRSAVLQVISAVLDFDMNIQEAIEAPRIHTEGAGSVVELENGVSKEAAKILSQYGHQVNIWKEKNLFFGGAQAVSRNPQTGELKGAGDSRRGGAAVMAK
jgi:gamma-glutamyltranspeptidase/glutathione hydrolase